jgi:hypothetical protein
MSDTVQKLLEGSRRFFQASRRFIQLQLGQVGERASSTSSGIMDAIQKLLEGSTSLYKLIAYKLLAGSRTSIISYSSRYRHSHTR